MHILINSIWIGYFRGIMASFTEKLH